MLKITPYASEPLSSAATYDDVTSFFAFRVFKQSTAVGLTPTVCFDLKWRVGDGGGGGGGCNGVSFCGTAWAELLAAVREQGVPFGDGDTVNVTFLHATLTSE